MKRWQSILLGLIISVIAIYLALRGAQLNRVAEALRTARYEYVLVALAIISASTYVRGLRWSALVQGRLSPTRAFWLFNTGFLFNNALPLRLGEVVRAYLASRNSPLRAAEALSSIVIERLMDVLMLVVFLAALLQMPWLPIPDWATKGGLLMGVAAVAGVVVLYIAARNPTWFEQTGRLVLGRLPLPKRINPEHILEQLGSFLDGLVSLREPRTFLFALGWSLLSWIMSGLASWLALFAFEDFGRPGLDIGLLAVTAAGLGIAVPSLPGGVGPFEAAVKLALVAVGYAAEPSLSYALMLHAMSFVSTTVLGALGMIREGMSFGEVASAARQLGQADAQSVHSEGNVA